MSKKEEKITAIELLESKLLRLRLHKSPAAQAVVELAKAPGVSSDLVSGIMNLIHVALESQKKQLKDAVEKMAV